MSLVSIIIPAHNEEEYIRSTIQSLRRQIHGDFSTETIVVTNGCDSSDDTANIAEDLSARVFDLSVGNVSAARNKGAQEAYGDIFVFNDADTQVASNYLNVITKTVERGFDYGCAIFKPENMHPITWLYSLGTWTTGFLLRDAGGNMFAKREAFEKVDGGFDVNLSSGEDTDLSRRMRQAGARYKFLHSTHIITSMRKFEERGYTREFFLNQCLPYFKDTFLPNADKRR